MVASTPRCGRINPVGSSRHPQAILTRLQLRLPLMPFRCLLIGVSQRQNIHLTKVSPADLQAYRQTVRAESARDGDTRHTIHVEGHIVVAASSSVWCR